MGALHHFMEYLAIYPNFHLDYRKYRTAVIGLDGYCDADYGNSSSRRSWTGNLLQCCRALVHWKSKLQKTIVLSKAEA